MKSPANIVFFLVDDMGWMDLTCQGSKFYETPNIDRIAREGMRFTDAYAACLFLFVLCAIFTLIINMIMSIAKVVKS